GVLVGELAALGLHDPWAGVVFRRDQLDVVFLATVLVGDGLGEFGVVAFDAGVARKHRLSGRGWGSCDCSPCPGAEAALAGGCRRFGTARPLPQKRGAPAG